MLSTMVAPSTSCSRPCRRQALLGHDLADQLEDLAIELVARQLGRRRGVDAVVERRLDPCVRALERFDAPIGWTLARRARRRGRRRCRGGVGGGGDSVAGSASAVPLGASGCGWRPSVAPEHAHRLPSGQSRRRCRCGVRGWIAGDPLGDLLDRRRRPCCAHPPPAGRHWSRAATERASNGITKSMGRPMAASNSLRADLALAMLADAVGDHGDLAGRVGRRQQGELPQRVAHAGQRQVGHQDQVGGTLGTCWVAGDTCRGSRPPRSGICCAAP